MEFPEIRGRSLAGEDVLIPTGLPGEVHVLILAFRQGQQADVDRWIAALAAEGVTGIYELPMLGARWQAFRRVIDGGMATSIRTPEVLARTITVYGQIGPVEKSLALPTRGEVHTVVESAGQVLYIAHGPPRDPTDVERVVRAARSA